MYRKQRRATGRRNLVLMGTDAGLSSRCTTKCCPNAHLHLQLLIGIALGAEPGEVLPKGPAEKVLAGVKFRRGSGSSALRLAGIKMHCD